MLVSNVHLDNPLFHLTKSFLLLRAAKAHHSANKVLKVLHLLQKVIFLEKKIMTGVLGDEYVDPGHGECS